MKSAEAQPLIDEEMPSVPASVLDRFSTEIDTSAEQWRLAEPARASIINWNRVPDGRLKHALK